MVALVECQWGVTDGYEMDCLIETERKMQGDDLMYSSMYSTRFV